MQSMADTGGAKLLVAAVSSSNQVDDLLNQGSHVMTLPEGTYKDWIKDTNNTAVDTKVFLEQWDNQFTKTKRDWV